MARRCAADRRELFHPNNLNLGAVYGSQQSPDIGCNQIPAPLGARSDPYGLQYFGTPSLRGVSAADGSQGLPTVGRAAACQLGCKGFWDPRRGSVATANVIKWFLATVGEADQSSEEPPELPALRSRKQPKPLLCRGSS